MVIDLGLIEYKEAYKAQRELVSKRKLGEIDDSLIICEHEPVFTIGRMGKIENLLTDVKVLRVDRGGDITFHGPGQLVGYPIIHLGEAGLRVLEYVGALEETLIRVADAYGVEAGRDRRNRGVWAGNCKLAALGIRVSHQVTMHGFALNVNTRLDDYRGIVACGLRDAGVTSLSSLLGRALEMGEVKARVAEAFRSVFGYEAQGFHES